MRDAEKTIGNLIDKQSVVYLSSIDEDGFPNTKAFLRPRIRDGIQTFYFHTNTSSMHVSQFQSNAKACFYICDKRFFRGVMLIGTIEVMQDVKHKEMLWQEGDTMYYPLGVTDPDYCVLKFRATKGRFYRNFDSENFTIQ